MKRTAQQLLLLIILASSIYGCKDCSKKSSCPAYEPGLLETWFPYQDNDHLQFRNASGGARVFSLRSIEQTGPYETRGTECSARKTLGSLETDSLGQRIFQVMLTQTRGGTDAIHEQEASLFIGLGTATLPDVRDTGITSILIQGQHRPAAYYSTITLGGQNFSNVRAAVRDTALNKSRGLSRVYFTRQQGLVAFAEFPGDTLWVLQ
jgi:hypothetical protein